MTGSGRSENLGERADQEKNPMPFDGERLIFDGFDPIVEFRFPTAGYSVQALGPFISPRSLG